MKISELNKVIAEDQGWINVHFNAEHLVWLGELPNSAFKYLGIPNYVGDRNVITEAINSLSESEWFEYYAQQ